jgi:hypothetical protein
VGVAVGALVAVGLGVAEGAFVVVGFGVAVAPFVTVGAFVGVGQGVGFSVAVGDSVPEGSSLGSGVGEPSSVGPGVTVAEGSEVGTGEEVGFAVATRVGEGDAEGEREGIRVGSTFAQAATRRTARTISTKGRARRKRVLCEDEFTGGVGGGVVVSIGKSSSFPSGRIASTPWKNVLIISDDGTSNRSREPFHKRC